MLRAVLDEVEAVRSSSSMLRGPAVACGHPFELGGGSSVTVARSAVGARSEVARGGSGNWGRRCLSAKADRTVLPSGNVEVGRDRGSLRSKARACQDPGPDLSWPASSPRPEKLQKQRAAQPGACRRTPTAVSSYNGLRMESLRGALEACG
jgi:hypothetical protein